MKYIVIAEEGERQMAQDLFPGIDIIVTGVGALNIMKSLMNVARDSELINIGYAGAPNIPVGTKVEVGEVHLLHPHVTYPEPEFKLQGNVPCYTSTDFVLASDYRDCVFDMELAFICGMGFKSVRSIKFVSDNLDLDAYHELTNGVE